MLIGCKCKMSEGFIIIEFKFSVLKFKFVIGRGF